MSQGSVVRRVPGAVALLILGASWATPDPVLEIRCYNLKPGTRAAFRDVAEREALPLLARFGIDVVAHGPSVHDENSYYLMRTFPSLEDRQRAEDRFYGSEEWKTGPRDAVLAAIESYTTVVVPTDDATLAALRRTGRPMTTGKEGAMSSGTAAEADRTKLLALNEDYIRSVQAGDVKRFREILADDFLCSLPDGSLVDRAGFLERTAQPVTIKNLEAHDVNVRLMGDVAIVHGRTTYTGSEGKAGSGRYTDVWARRSGTWVAVAAHVTRN
jgi:ketosteroid isomerase-like protein